MNLLNRLPSYLPIVHLALAVLLTLELGLVSYSSSPLPIQANHHSRQTANTSQQ